MTESEFFPEDPSSAELDQMIADSEEVTLSRPADVLTQGQRDVLALIAEGHPDKVIADRLGISPRTVRRRIQGLMESLGAHSRGEAVAAGGLAGLVRAGR